MSEYAVVLTTTDSKEVAEELARSSVRGRLAACAQIVGPIKSVFWWEGDIDTEEEFQVWFKTPRSRFSALESHLASVHTYDVPEVILLPIEAGHQPYLSWMDTETSPS